MAFLYQSVIPGQTPPLYKLEDYDINLVVSTALQIAEDQYAPPEKREQGQAEPQEVDPHTLFTVQDSDRLSKLRADTAAEVLKAYLATAKKSDITLFNKAERMPYKTDWTEEQRHTLDTFRAARDAYFGEHFNEKFARQQEVQELLRKRLQGRLDPRINELFALFDQLNANPLPAETTETEETE